MAAVLLMARRRSLVPVALTDHRCQQHQLGAFRLGQAEWAVREYVGLIVYRLLGRTSALFPAP